ncbi:MAG: glutamate--tRNA ligase [Rhodothermaceae bacterium]|nr:glutamate--tRNA ligase [Rhodothermaceae bacterium]
MTNHVRVRFAPSPTGMLHIGGLRTALFNYLFAKHHKGSFVLRIEDTDQARYVPDAEADITTSLKWAGLHVDEGPDKGGKFGPYRQSERSELYSKYAAKLVEDGHAYYAFDTAEEIDNMRQRLQSPDNPTPKYDSVTRMEMKNSLTLPADEVKKRLESGEPHIIRLKVPENETIRFDDLIRGDVSFESRGLDDQVLLKSDGLPTYHLANVVDDHLMEISHVIRGEEWLSSAPKHILLYRYLGWKPPVMAHLPLIMSPKGGKLSKRNAEELGIPINVRDYIAGAYEPAAVINFLAYLGWSTGDDREILTPDEMIATFSLDRVSKSGAIFDLKKLEWYNEHYLRAMPVPQLAGRVREVAEREGYTGLTDAYLETVVRLMIERSVRMPDIVEQGRFLFDAPKTIDEGAVKKAWKENTGELVTEFRDKIAGLSEAEFTAAQVKAVLSGVVEAKGIGFGKLMLPVRLAVTGAGSGPDLFQTMALLGRDEVIGRINRSLDQLATK